MKRARLTQIALVIVGLFNVVRNAQRKGGPLSVGGLSSFELDGMSVVEAIAQLDGELAGEIPVEAAEGETVVVFEAVVGYVEGGEGGGDALAEVLAQGEIEGGVRREVVAEIGLAGEGVGEAGAVGNVGGGVGAPGEGDVSADVEGVALVVVERGESG